MQAGLTRFLLAEIPNVGISLYFEVTIHGAQPGYAYYFFAWKLDISILWRISLREVLRHHQFLLESITALRDYAQKSASSKKIKLWIIIFRLPNPLYYTEIRFLPSWVNQNNSPNNIWTSLAGDYFYSYKLIEQLPFLNFLQNCTGNLHWFEGNWLSFSPVNEPIMNISVFIPVWLFVLYFLNDALLTFCSGSYDTTKRLILYVFFMEIK